MSHLRWYVFFTISPFSAPAPGLGRGLLSTNISPRWGYLWVFYLNFLFSLDLSSSLNMRVEIPHYVPINRDFIRNDMAIRWLLGRRSADSQIKVSKMLVGVLNRHFFPCVPQTHVIPSGSEGSSYSLDTFTHFQLRPFVFVAPESVSSHLNNFCSGACFGKRSSLYKYFATLRLVI